MNGLPQSSLSSQSYGKYWQLNQNNQDTEHTQTQTNVTQKVAPSKQLKTLKNLRQDRAQTEPGSVAFYDIRPGNGVGLFYQPLSPYGARGFGEMRYSRQARYRFLTRRNHSQNLNPGLLGLSPASWPLSHGSSSLAWLISRIFLSCIYYARKKKKNSYPMYLSLPADHVPQLLQTMFSYAIRI